MQTNVSLTNVDKIIWSVSRVVLNFKQYFIRSLATISHSYLGQESVPGFQVSIEISMALPSAVVKIILSSYRVIVPILQMRKSRH